MDGSGQRMKAFISSLPETNILIVYFSHSRGNRRNIKPYVANQLRILKVKSSLFYINCGDNGEWVYIYRPDSLRYLFTRIDTHAHTAHTAFVGKELAEYEGGSRFDIAHMGSHLTIGLRGTPTQQLLNTHATIYEESPHRNFEFDVERANECWVPLLTPITATTSCVSKRGIATGKVIGTEYQNFPTWIDVIERLRGVFAGTTQIGSGPRGGFYEVRNGVKRYQKNMRSIPGGTPQSSQITDGILDMLYLHVVKPVLEVYEAKQKQSVEATLLYDPTNHFQSQKLHIVILYDISEHDTRRVFYLEAERVFAAYNAYQYDLEKSVRSQTEEPSKHALTCFEEFRSGHIAREHSKELSHM